MWYDGIITNVDNELQITTSGNSSVLVLSEGDTHLYSIKSPISFNLELVDAKVYIITDKEGYHKSDDLHIKTLSLIERRHKIFGSASLKDYERDYIYSAYFKLEPLSGHITTTTLEDKSSTDVVPSDEDYVNEDVDSHNPSDVSTESSESEMVID